jgi:S1-C subfamily serine protease
MLKLEAFLLAAAASLPAAAQSAEPSHRRVYEKVSDSVVAVRALAPLGERSGSGVVLSADGLILTSHSVCPEGAQKIRVWTRGPRLHDAELVAASRPDELALLRIKPEEKLKPIEFGSSSALRVGQVSYTIGNAANSIILDDQPSLNVGILSGFYRLNEERASSTYKGMVLETTAAVNVGMEGAPCLDASGKMIGMVTLNYSPHRFLGAAIPIDEIRPVIERLRKGGAAAAPGPLPAAGRGTVGLAFKDENGRVVVAEVDKDGPAARAGLQKGDVVVGLGDAPVKSSRDLAERLRGLEAGSVLWLKIEIGGAAEAVKLVAEAER